jgi:acyl CoA:acetate/3-ketoacid CoA transferase beta subunit
LQRARRDRQDIIAHRLARELHDGDCVNLGIGLLTVVACTFGTN